MIPHYPRKLAREVKRHARKAQLSSLLSAPYGDPRRQNQSKGQIALTTRVRRRALAVHAGAAWLWLGSARLSHLYFRTVRSDRDQGRSVKETFAITADDGSGYQLSGRLGVRCFR